MSETDKQPAVPPLPAKARRFGVGFVRMVECSLLTGILLAILIYVAPRFQAVLADISKDAPALTVVVMSASTVAKNQWYVFVPLAGAIIAGMMVLPFILPARLTVVISTLLLITLVAATVAVLLGIYLPLINFYGAGLT